MKATMGLTLGRAATGGTPARLLVAVICCLGMSAASAVALNKHNKPGAPHAGVKHMAVAHPAPVDPVPDAPLGPAELAIAQHVEVGTVPCELGMSVTVTADARSPGYFDVQARTLRFRMVPVVTGTGAIRLEDRVAGAVWLQLPHKSMLMSQKLGTRLADACVTPTQAQVALALSRNPPPGLLDGPARPAPATVSQARDTVE